MTMEVAAISYNMSVFSAMGNTTATFASEYSFMKDRANIINVNENGEIVTPNANGKLPAGTLKITDFFLNTINHLAENVLKKGAKVIGIQEYFAPTKNLIMNALLKVNPNFICKESGQQGPNFAQILTVWDRTVFGSQVGGLEADLGTTVDPETKNTFSFLKLAGPGNDIGRPISIIKTTAGYTLINFHGINRARVTADGTATEVDNSKFLKKIVEARINEAGLDDINPAKTIMMCDSNDREHKLGGSDSPNHLVIIKKGEEAHFSDGHTESEKTEKSCCYNWDSCGVDIPKLAANGKSKISLGAAGVETKYAYTGDYILGVNFVVKTTAVDSPEVAGASIASDHKLVHAVLKMPQEGIVINKNKRCRGRKSRKSRKMLKQKSRKTRR